MRNQCNLVMKLTIVMMMVVSVTMMLLILQTVLIITPVSMESDLDNLVPVITDSLTPPIDHCYQVNLSLLSLGTEVWAAAVCYATACV